MPVKTGLTKRQEVMALLAAAGGELRCEIHAHRVDRETFDQLPGEPITRGTSTWKTGSFGNLEWSAFLAREET